MKQVFWDVDTQVDFILPDGKLCVPGAETIADNLGRLTDFAHANGIRIVASSDNHDPDDAELSDMPDFQDTFPPHCLRGTPGQARIPQTALRNPLVIEPEAAASALPALLENHAGDILFHKHWFDVFTNPHVSPVVEGLEHYGRRPLRCCARRLRCLRRRRTARAASRARIDGCRGRRARHRRRRARCDPWRMAGKGGHDHFHASSSLPRQDLRT